jgi:alpha-ketoglutarate-dependent taurine dioxygenase
MNRAAFGLYFETQLASTLNKGDVVILDNLAVHKSPRAAACLKEHGA